MRRKRIVEPNEYGSLPLLCGDSQAGSLRHDVFNGLLTDIHGHVTDAIMA
jgi:hypothetical protein